MTAGPFAVRWPRSRRGGDVSWIKKVALRWALGLPKSHFGAFERGAELAGAPLNEFVITTVVRKAVELQERDRREEEEIDAAVMAYERQRGWV